MCEVCQKREGFPSKALSDVLGKGFNIKFTSHPRRWEEMVITNRETGKSISLTADGDDGGYFHWQKEVV